MHGGPGLMGWRSRPHINEYVVDSPCDAQHQFALLIRMSLKVHPAKGASPTVEGQAALGDTPEPASLVRDWLDID